MSALLLFAVSVPWRSRGLSDLGPPKAAIGIADAVASEGTTGRWVSAPKVQLLQALMLLFLLLDVGADHGLVAADRRDEVAPGPEVLPDAGAPALAVYPCEMDGALALDVSDHLRDGVFGRDGDHHVHVIGQEMPLLDPALLLLRQGAEHLAEMRTQCSIVFRKAVW